MRLIRLATILATMAAAGCGSSSLPGDDALIAKFRANEKEFRSVVGSMSGQGGRMLKAETRDRIDALGVKLAAIDGKADPPRVVFRAASTGWAMEGTSKGFLYSTEAPAPILPSLDDAHLGRRSSAFRAITQDWYLYLRHD